MNRAQYFTKRRGRVHWLFATSIVFLLGASPGDVGACGSEQTIVDPEVYCLEKNGWICRRQHDRGEVENIDQCLVDVLDLCEGTQWPPACLPAPTDREAEACIDQLRATENLHVALNDIPECELCPAP